MLPPSEATHRGKTLFPSLYRTQRCHLLYLLDELEEDFFLLPLLLPLTLFTTSLFFPHLHTQRARGC
jgi:hypothetical protein